MRFSRPARMAWLPEQDVSSTRNETGLSAPSRVVEVQFHYHARVRGKGATRNYLGLIFAFARLVLPGPAAGRLVPGGRLRYVHDSSHAV